MKKFITILFFAGFLTTASFAQSGHRQQNNNQSNGNGYQSNKNSGNNRDQYSQNSRNENARYNNTKIRLHFSNCAVMRLKADKTIHRLFPDTENLK